MCWGQDRVDQPSRKMSASEADQIFLMCNYTTEATNTDVYLFWDKHLPNISPTFILNKVPFSDWITEPDFKKRFFAKLDTTSRTVPLMIKDVCVSDCCVLLCSEAHCDWNTLNTHTKTCKINKNSSALLTKHYKLSWNIVKSFTNWESVINNKGFSVKPSKVKFLKFKMYLESWSCEVQFSDPNFITNTHARTHARTQARTHAHTHTHTHTHTQTSLKTHLFCEH